MPSYRDLGYLDRRLTNVEATIEEWKPYIEMLKNIPVIEKKSLYDNRFKPEIVPLSKNGEDENAS